MSIDIINPNYLLYQSSLKSVDNRTQVEAQQSSETGNFSDALKKAVNKEKSQNLDIIFEKAAAIYQVPATLLKAVAKAESNFNPQAVSSAGAQGIMQLMPATARSLGVSDSFDPEQNIMGGAKYLSQMLERFQGNTELALAAYNAGPGNVMKYEGVPPFKETQNYISKVLAYCNDSGSIQPLNETIFTAVSEPSLRNDYFGLASAAAFGDGSLDPKDAALFLSLYQYRLQLNVLSDADSDEG